MEDEKEIIDSIGVDEPFQQHWSKDDYEHLDEYERTKKRWNQFGIKYDVVGEDLITKEKKMVFSHHLKNRAKSYKNRIALGNTRYYYTLWEVHKDGKKERIT